jgi:hypothetical protein
VIVRHRILVSEIVLLSVHVQVVRWIDVNSSFKNMSRWICSVEVGDERRFAHNEEIKGLVRSGIDVPTATTTGFIIRAAESRNAKLIVLLRSNAFNDVFAGRIVRSIRSSVRHPAEVFLL